MAASTPAGGVPDEVATLLQKYKRMKFFIKQYEEEWALLDKIKESCSDLCAHKEKAKHLSLYGPGQPCKNPIYDVLTGIE